MKKKIMLSLASIGSLVAPVSSIVACASGGLNFDANKKDSVIMIVGSVGHDDKGFLQGGYDGSMEAKKSIAKLKEYGEIKAPNSTIPTAKEVTNKALQAGGYIILGVGFQYPSFFDSKDYAEKYKDREFIGIDGIVVDDKFQPKKPNKNVTTVAFKAEQAAFLTGVATGIYLSKNYADYSSDGGLKVGSFGGAPYSPIKHMISGYIHGIAYYNTKLAKDVNHKISFIGWNGAQNGFTGGFVPSSQSTTKSNTLLDKKVDVVYPVAGGQVGSMVDAIKGVNNSKTKVIGVDADQSEVFGTDGKLFITSSLKDTKVATLESIKAIYGVDGAKATKGANNIKGLAEGFVGMAKGVFGNDGFKGTSLSSFLNTSGGIDTTSDRTVFEQINDPNNDIYRVALNASKDWDKAKVIFGATSDQRPELTNF